MAAPTGIGYTDEEIEEWEKERNLEELFNILPKLDPFYDDDEDDYEQIYGKRFKYQP